MFPCLVPLFPNPPFGKRQSQRSAPTRYQVSSFGELPQSSSFSITSSPSARPIFNEVARWKSAGGFLYSILATALFAGVIPFIFLQLRRESGSGSTWRTFLFVTVFWGYRGLEIDAFYRLQSLLFGSQPTLETVAAKVACDLFVYNVCVGRPPSDVDLPLDEFRI